jgi:NADH-quinone oxidoreductase subunit L
MEKVINIFILIPLLGFLFSLVIPAKKEEWLSRVAFGTAGLNLIVVSIFTLYWILQGTPLLNMKDFALFATDGYEFFIDFCFDKISVVFLLLGAMLTFLVTIYSRYYLHREDGYKRFFNTVLFFYLGYNVVTLSGNFETLFLGWEILGVSSFLLIAFYRNRYLPVKNAVKVFSIYRIADVGLILAMWLSHHLWLENITFVKLANYDLVHEHLQNHTWVGVAISLMILLAAAAKSAQLPFSSWLPRAMEGPTPSSAIFYGSLSVHMGVFLLLRTYHFWEHQISIRIAIAVVGALTAMVATGIARVQSSIKSQVAYSSIAQIGIIFIEVALGFTNLALFHIAGNAFLRTYQLLVSPSVVSYLIREQFYNFKPREHTVEDSLPKRIEQTLYVLCLKEWNLDTFLYKRFWNPLKWAGKQLNFFTLRRIVIFALLVCAIALVLLKYEAYISADLIHALPTVFALFGLIFVLKAFTERIHVRLSWTLIIINHVMIVLGVSFNEHFTTGHSFIYLSGIFVSGLLGYWGFFRLKRFEGNIDLDRFHGFVYHHPKIAFACLLGGLGLAGFPITPTFVGEDLIFSHIHEDQFFLAFLIALSLIVNGIAVIRIYARVFLGPHVKSVYDMAYRSS